MLELERHEVTVCAIKTILKKSGHSYSYDYLNKYTCMTGYSCNFLYIYTWFNHRIYTI